MQHQKEALLNTLASYTLELGAADRKHYIGLIRAELGLTRSNVNSLLWVIWTTPQTDFGITVTPDLARKQARHTSKRRKDWST